MKVTLDLPVELLRHARASAAERGITRQAWVIEALTAKLAAITYTPGPHAKDGRPALASRLRRQPDGPYINLDGIEDESFFRKLERIRSRR